ncbi:uncharacterized protein LOC110737991 [Chenopodium quinoa]|uniref:Late embryogenesis abundant protein LEA-2 subgroup domain-containing protein n=1 Tax=Chenopodium quinoa TaxID=63459 RepID=A0A803NAC4_CHEQI|nr:uncharacterized protein LOC110737991 [Chenopodium quinoa]
MESRKILDPNPLIPTLEPRRRPPNYVVLHLPFNLPTFDPPVWKKIYKTTLFLLIIATSTFVLWPSDPDVKIVRMRTHHVRIHTRPRISVDVSLDATVRVRNKAVYSMDYSSLDVAIGYRGKELGHVMSGGGHVRAKGSSYVDTRVEFTRVEVVRELIYLVEDLAKGFIQFDTVTQVDGSFGFAFFQVPLKGKISCEIVVSLKQQTLTSQNCYPELEEKRDA